MNITRIHRLAAGTVTAAALAADSAALVKDWTTTLTSGGWEIAPGLTSDSARYIVKKYTERSLSLAGTIGTFGLMRDAWRIARMDDAMWAVLIGKLPGESTAVTIYTPDRQKTGGAGWVTLNCTAIRPSYEELRTKDGIWYVDTPIVFINATTAAAS